MTRYIIIGTGIAGFSAAQTLRNLEPAADISLVSDDPHGFYSRPGLAYYLTGEIPERQLFPFIKKSKYNPNVQHVHGRVSSINPHSHSIDIDSSGSLNYDRLLLATGSRSVPLDIPGADLSAVVKLDNLEDTRRILSQVRRTKTAVVVGGGVVAVELVEGLVAQGIKVHYLLRGDWFWPNVLAEAESRMLEHYLVHDGVTLHHRTEIVEILSKKGKLTAVRTTAGDTIRCDMLAVGIGVRPCQELAVAAGLKTDRGILVNEYLQTSDPHIYAAGDVAQIYDPLSGHASIDNLWYPGRKQGRVAAMNMLGRNEVYQRTVATNVLRMAGVMTTIIGAIGSGRDDSEVYTSRGSSESWQQLPNTIAAESGTDLSQLRLIVGEHTLLGALVMGDQRIARPLRELIIKQVDITPIRPQLLHSNPALGQSVMDYWVKTKG
jgi:3-phenylpropionate/trans-cinnamate dioxygenase ferredoxin reductase component